MLALLLLVASAAPAAAADPARDRQWGLDVIGADAAHAVGRGAGTVIAVVDTGVDLDHEDLVDRIVPGIDLVDDDRTAQDEHGHGTHVAGIAAATGDNGRGITGVAPRAAIMPVRVLGADGSGSAADVADGVRWAADNGADVINLSLTQAGQSVIGSSLAPAIRYAWDRGAVVVVAAGNQFVLSSGFAEEPAIVVSATTRTDGKPSYSNGVGSARWGMAAPGGGCALLTCATEDRVFSTYWDPGQDDVYAWLAGTSMAAPHVAGAAAVLLSLGLDQQQVVDRLLATATDIGASGRDSTYGAGRLDLAAAVADGRGDADDAGNRATPTPRPSPSPAARAAPVDDDGAASSPAPTSPSPSPSSNAAAAPSTPTDPVTPSAPVPSPSQGPVPPAAPPTADDTASVVGSSEVADAPDDRTPVLLLALGAVAAAGTGVALAGRGTRRG